MKYALFTVDVASFSVYYTVIKYFIHKIVQEMKMKTCEEILKELEDKYKMSISVRTFNFYRDNGFIPPVQARRKKKGLYLDYTAEKIAFVRNQKAEGMSLTDASKLFDAQRQIVVAKKERLAAKQKIDFLDKWEDSEIRKQRLCKFLKLDPQTNKVDVGMVGTLPDHKPESYLAVFDTDYIDFYRIQIDYSRSDNWHVLDKKRLSNDGYDLIVRMISDNCRKHGRLIDKDDIFLQIFFG